MKVLVLGATGFIGAEVVRQCQAAGIDVVATSRKAAPGITACDITDQVALRAVTKNFRPTIVVNCSGIGVTPSSRKANPIYFDAIRDVNEGGVANLLQVAAEALEWGTPKLIHLASSRDRAGAHRKDDYLETKENSTRIFLQSVVGGLDGLSLEVFNTYGVTQPPGRLASLLVQAASRRSAFQLEAPFQVRDFVHVGDVAAAVIKAAQSDAASSGSIEIGTGVGTSVLELARMIYALAEAPQELIRFDEAAPAGEPEVADISAAKEILGWQPRVDLMAGLREMVVAERSQTSLEVDAGVMSVRAPR